MVTVGAAEMGDEGPKEEGAAKLNAEIVGAADNGLWEPGAEFDGAKLNEESTSIRSQGDDGMSRG